MVHDAQDERYFSFQYGLAAFVMLDVNNQSPDCGTSGTNCNITGENEGGTYAPDWMPGSRQYAWLEETLQQAEQESRFTFVVWHHAPYSSGPHAQTPPADDQSGVPTRALNALLQRHRVTAVFNGHDEMAEMSDVPGTRAEGGDPRHTLRYFLPGTVGDGLRDELAGDLNPHRRQIKVLTA